jgi:glucose-1-phosphate thymidylyltransferase
MKGIILAGGYGKRLRPLTAAVNKHLLPMGCEPMVSRAVRALLETGVEQIAVVTAPVHTTAFADLLLDRYLVHRVLPQWRPGGIAHAIEAAHEFAGGEPIIVLLADNLWQQSLRPWADAFRGQARGARCLLSFQPRAVDRAQVAVPVFDGGRGAPDRIVRVDEKPELPGSQYAVTGAYAFDERAWELLPGQSPSARGELEVTGLLNWYAERGELEHDVVEGWWYDAGQSIEAYYEALDTVRSEEGR